MSAGSNPWWRRRARDSIRGAVGTETLLQEAAVLRQAVADISNSVMALRADLGGISSSVTALRADLEGICASLTPIADGQVAALGELREVAKSVVKAEGTLGRLADSASRFRAVYLGGGRLLIRFRHLPLVFIADSTDRIIIPHLIQEGEYETEVTAWLLANLAPKDVCFDVGANIGYHACIMAKRAHQGRVIAMEPDPDTFALLSENRNINWLEAVLQPRELALAAEEGELTLHRVRDRSANTSIARLSAEFASAAAVEQSSTVVARCSTLDAMAAAEGLIPDVVKLDVEGAELLVLRGARATISRAPGIRILMEWSPAQLEMAGFAAADLFDEIAAQGLVIHRLRHDGSEEPSASRDTMLNTGYWNVVLRRAW
jgi:FkbM family methyltransferase